MPDLAQDSADSKRLHAVPCIFEPGLFGQLPAWLDALDPPARERIGRALDDRTVRLVLSDGRALVVRSARA
jgi:hypothetical protein